MIGKESGKDNARGDGNWDLHTNENCPMNG
jgi:hypothetical protein